MNSGCCKLLWSVRSAWVWPHRHCEAAQTQSFRPAARKGVKMSMYLAYTADYIQQKFDVSRYTLTRVASRPSVAIQLYSAIHYTAVQRYTLSMYTTSTIPLCRSVCSPLHAQHTHYARQPRRRRLSTSVGVGNSRFTPETV